MLKLPVYQFDEETNDLYLCISGYSYCTKFPIYEIDELKSIPKYGTLILEDFEKNIIIHRYSDLFSKVNWIYVYMIVGEEVIYTSYDVAEKNSHGKPIKMFNLNCYLPDDVTTFNANWMISKKNNKLFTRFNINPSESYSSNSEGKMIFPDKNWKDIMYGPAEMHVTVNTDKYAFVTGHMIEIKYDIEYLVNKLHKRSINNYNEFIHVKNDYRDYWILSEYMMVLGRMIHIGYYAILPNDNTLSSDEWINLDVELSTIEKINIRDYLTNYIDTNIGSDVVERINSFNNPQFYVDFNNPNRFINDFRFGDISDVLDYMKIEQNSYIEDLLFDAEDLDMMNVQILENQPMVSINKDNIISILIDSKFTKQEIVDILDFVDNVNSKSDKILRGYVKKGRIKLKYLK